MIQTWFQINLNYFISLGKPLSDGINKSTLIYKGTFLQLLLTTVSMK